jgi:hypothetical protein
VPASASKGDVLGKQGGGGPTLGLPAKGESRVGVFLLKPSDVGNAFCGGRIGSRGCVCVDAVTSCKIAVHRTNKVDFQDVDSSETLVLIKVPAGKGSAAVYDSPSIVASSIPR